MLALYSKGLLPLWNHLKLRYVIFHKYNNIYPLSHHDKSTVSTPNDQILLCYLFAECNTKGFSIAFLIELALRYEERFCIAGDSPRTEARLKTFHFQRNDWGRANALNWC